MTDKNLPAAEEDKQEKSPAQQDYDRGREFMSNNDPVQAANLFHNALIGFEQGGDENGVANATDKLGDLCLEKKDYAKAIEHYRRAYAICEKAADEFSLTALNKKIARAQCGLADFDAAINIHLDLMETYRIYNNPGKVVETLETLAEIYLQKGDRDAAIDALRVAANIHNGFNHKRHAQALLDKAAEIAKNA